MEEENKGYIITITGKGKRRQIHLSAFAFNSGIFLIMISAFIFIGTCSYSVYSALHHKQNNEIVRSVQHAAEMQQEQILTISKKAVNLSETLQNLAQQEEELRIQAGLEKPAKEDKIPGMKNTEDEIPELEEIKPIEGLPTPEELPALENIPSTVEIPAPKSEWISPENGGYSGAQIQTPVIENPAPVENSATVTVPAPQSEWISPENGGYSGANVQTPVIENPAPVENPVTVTVPTPQSEWISPENGGYSGAQIQTPAVETLAPVENPANVSNPKTNETPAPVVTTSPEVKFTAYFGQGGPLPDLGISDVAEALSMVEQRVAIRLESLDEFQAELKLRRERMSTVLAVPSNPVGSYGNIVIDNGFARDLNLDLGQFGGSPTANPNVPSIWPTTGVVTSPYGLRWGGSDFHPGIDIANDMGTPIVATADGIVEYAGWNAGGYGNMVDINHGNGLMTRYGHASQVVVTVGQAVKRGQLIAYMGSTGFSTGPHCHYEVHVNGQRVNPISYL